MSDKVAFFLALMVAGAAVVDYIYADFTYSLFVARKLSDLRAYIAFWR